MLRISKLSLFGVTLIVSPISSQEVISAFDVSQGNRGAAFDTLEDSFPGAVGIGDVDGDGYDDILFSALTKCVSEKAGHIAILVYGRSGLVGKHPLDCIFPRSVSFPPSPALGLYYVTVSPAGDINNDGYADFLIVYFGYQPDLTVLWVAFLVYGKSGLAGVHPVEEIGTSIPGVRLWSSDPSDGIRGMVNIGDFNGDGRVDLAVGAPASSPKDRDHAGKVFVIFDASNVPIEIDLSSVGTTVPGIQILGALLPTSAAPNQEPFMGERLGLEVTGIEDVNGDGYTDIIVKPQEVLVTDVGRHYIILGSANPPTIIDMQDLQNGVNLEGVVVVTGPAATGSLITSARVGDMNGDGYADVLFGAPSVSWSPLFGGEGAAYLLYGAQDLPAKIRLVDLPPSSLTKLVEYEPGSSFGKSIAEAGDLNSDRTPDFLVGAPDAAPNGLYQAGEAYAIYGSRTFGPEVLLENGFKGIVVLGESAEGQLGWVVAPGGDFNGDGSLDFIAVAPWIKEDTGDGPVKFTRTYVIYGDGGKPSAVRIQKLEPAWGPVQGGTAITIVGTGFSGDSKVTFGSTPALSSHVLTPFKIQAVTPAGQATGFVDLTVQVGGESRTLADAFEYTPNFPEIDLAHLGLKGLVLQGELRDSLGGKDRTGFGDITGDGMDELVVTGPRFGRLVIGVVKGGADLPERLDAFIPSPRVSVISREGDEVLKGHQTTVSVLGDVNADGIRDLGIGQSEAIGFIVFGRQILPERIDLDQEASAGRAVRIVPPPKPTGSFKLVSVGDLTGDRIDDVAVGLSESFTDASGTLRLEGEIFFVEGRRLWPREINLGDRKDYFSRIVGSRQNQRLAAILLPAGDINGDGLQDLLTDAGQGVGDLFVDVYAYVIYGSNPMPLDIDVKSYVAAGGGVAISPPGKFPPGNLFNLFDLAAPGDVDGDGAPDILLGNGGGGEVYQGMTYLIFGGAKLKGPIQLSENPTSSDGIVRILGEASYRASGYVGPAGDFNADGNADFVIGEKLTIDPKGKAGNVFLILGNEKLPERIELSRLGGRGIQIVSRDPRWAIGQTVGPSGDLNGDGSSDFAFGEQFRPLSAEDQPPEDASRLFMVYGPTGNTRFIRGDANQDSRVDVADVVGILAFLFLGGEAPCAKSALDTDDSGALDVTDAVYLLGYLFLGGKEPPAPFPDAGIDPTKDSLGCAGF